MCVAGSLRARTQEAPAGLQCPWEVKFKQERDKLEQLKFFVRELEVH